MQNRKSGASFKSWKNCIENQEQTEDFNCYFMLGMLKFVYGLQEEKQAFLNESNTYFEDCKNICNRLNKQMLNPEKITNKQYSLGKGRDISAIIPVDFVKSAHINLFEFIGTIIVVTDSLCEIKFKNIKTKSNINLIIKIQPTISNSKSIGTNSQRPHVFTIHFARDKMMAEVIKPYFE